MSLRAVRIALLLLTLAACALEEAPDGGRGAAADATRDEAPQISRDVSPAPLAFVGTDTCAGCHPAETEAWRGSHHDLAMQEASAATILGDFSAGPFDHFGETTRFVQGDDGFRVVATGPGGEAERDVSYVFGIDPLQQLLVPLPGGRLQALNVSWDARAAESGGQRWYHLHPDEPTPPGDVLHWAGPAQNWNGSCAACHSTGLRKAYDLEQDRFETSWAELDVACEACHGQGSLHAERARAGETVSGAGSGLPVELRNDAEWILDPGAPIARRATPRTSDAELESCAPCHSRRSSLRDASEPGRPFLDGYRPALLEAGLYQPDGQIEDEVYVWGSFLQSRMHAAGVTCSDCHDPHSLALAEPADTTCRTCHRPEVFATPGHHRHAAESAGSSCIACHMPARTYMGVDVRHDHSFRIPRPDLSVAIGTTNACSDCHADQPASWAAEAAAGWWGAPGEPHFGLALDAGRRGLPGADAALVALAGDARQPAIARATALTLLRAPSEPASAHALAAGLRDPDPLLRLGALLAASRVDPRSRMVLVKPLLGDPLRAVRIEAARVLGDIAPSALGADDGRRLARALAEYRAVQLANADRPSSHVNLALMALRRGDLAGARTSYEAALRVGPWFVPAYVNLADLDRHEGREKDAEARLRSGLAIAPESAELHHALGLTLVRAQRLDEALAALARAAELAPAEPRYAYVYAVGLHSAGRKPEALTVLAEARKLHPADPDLRDAETAFQQE